ncbi:trypsin-3-like [Hetaerina americana]|uniref:trypsin-3-like n=1 Tax=Hetaerina americana TaxID=62018 RepID=UPI003A7F2983
MVVLKLLDMQAYLFRGFKSKVSEVKNLQLVAGSVKIDEGTIHKISVSITHPNYDPNTYDWDIAVLKVSRPFVLSKTVSPVSLPEEGEELEAGVLVKVSGWGYTSDGGLKAKILQKITIPVYNQDACDLAYTATDRMFCAGEEEGGKDSCQVSQFILTV